MPKLVALAVCSASLLLAPATTTAASTTRVTCGQTLTQSVRLANDLIDCTGDGLIIGADNVTVNLNGHTVDGTVAQTGECNAPAGPAGINDAAGYDGLTIANGTVRQFTDGISSYPEGMADSRLRQLAVRDNAANGIALASGELLNNDNRIEDNVVSGNGCLGIRLQGAHGNHLQRNRVQGNNLAILICCGDHNTIESNVVSATRHDALIVCCADDAYNVIRYNTIRDNDESGIILCCSDGDQHNLIAFNSISGNAHQGILFEGANANVVRANHVFANGDDIGIDGSLNTIVSNWVSDAIGCEDDGCGLGIQLGSGHGNVIADNQITRTARDGIRIDAVSPDVPTADNLVRDNRVSDAGVDGIAVGIEGDGSVGALLLSGNTATRSADDGFDIRSAAATLAANRATRNGDLGIAAAPGVTDGGGNRAWANGNPLQCTNVLCAGPG